jgi:CDP-diacylglycerol--glycerol-3-phosphate 3-phosphatidyltransferase
MDPMADKLLVMAAMMIFVADGTIPAWAAVVILAREFAVSSIRLIAADQGTVIAANMWGKAKTMVTMIVLIFLLCRFPAINLFAGLSLQDLGVYVMVAITAISGYTYLKDNFAIFKDGFTSGKKGE